MGWEVAMEIAPATNAVSKLSQDGWSGKHLFYSAGKCPAMMSAAQLCSCNKVNALAR